MGEGEGVICFQIAADENHFRFGKSCTAPKIASAIPATSPMRINQSQFIWDFSNERRQRQL
jgi:hypothetical protein